MLDFRLHHGNPLMVDHTPGADVEAGKAIVIGDTVRISHGPIAAGELDALAAGGGVYFGPKVATTAISDGEQVYLTPGGSVTATATGNASLGFAVGDTPGDSDTVLFQHVAG